MNSATVERTIAYYNIRARDYAARTWSADLTSQRERFLGLIPSGGRILDAGCGSGRDLKAFIELGFSAVGIDASSELVEFARSATGAPCYLVSFYDLNWHNEFDGIWACASLLHIPKNRIGEVLKRLRDAMKLGGILYASLQEGTREEELPDGRFFADYSVREFTVLVGRVDGLTLLHTWKTRDVLSERRDITWLNFLVKREH